MKGTTRTRHALITKSRDDFQHEVIGLLAELLEGSAESKRLGRLDQRAVHAVEAGTEGAQNKKVTVLGTVRHAVLVDQLGVSEGNVKRFDGQPT